MHVDETILERVRAQFGGPAVLHWEGEVSEHEHGLITHNPSRRHDVTLFVFNGERLALIRKPHFPAGVWRTPGGGVQRGEEFVAGILREGREELGVDVEVARYLVATEALFRYGRETIRWHTHVFSASTSAEDLAPLDTEEIAAARWGTASELAGPIRTRLLETGRALWRYRVALHDATLAELAR